MEKVSPETKSAIENAYYSEYFNKTADADSTRFGKIARFFGDKHAGRSLAAIAVSLIAVIALIFVNPAAAMIPAAAWIVGSVGDVGMNFFCNRIMAGRANAALARDIDNGTLPERYNAWQQSIKQKQIERLQSELSVLQGKTAKKQFSEAVSTDSGEIKNAEPASANPAHEIRGQNTYFTIS